MNLMNQQLVNASKNKTQEIQHFLKATKESIKRKKRNSIEIERDKTPEIILEKE